MPDFEAISEREFCSRIYWSFRSQRTYKLSLHRQMHTCSSQVFSFCADALSICEVTIVIWLLGKKGIAGLTLCN